MDLGRKCHYQRWERAFKGSPELEGQSPQFKALQLVHQEGGNTAQIKPDMRLLISLARSCSKLCFAICCEDIPFQVPPASGSKYRRQEWF